MRRINHNINFTGQELHKQCKCCYKDSVRIIKRLHKPVTERWARSWSRRAGSQPSGDYKSSNRR